MNYGSNLTITGYNSKLSNLSFENKRDRTDKDGNYVGYRNGLYLNDDIVRKDMWSIDEIADRTEKFVVKIEVMCIAANQHKAILDFS